MIKDTFYQTISNILSGIILFLLIIILSRNLGVYEFGRYQLAVTIGTFAFLFLDGGFKNLIFREYTYPSDEIKNILNQLFSTAILHLIICSIFLLSIVQFFKENILFSLAIIFYSLYVFCFFISSYLKAKGKFILDAYWNLFFKIMSVIFVILISFFYKLNSEGVFILSIFGLFFCVFPVILKNKNFSFNKFNITFYKFTYNFFLIDLFTQIYFKSDILMVSYFKGYNENAIYTAASRIIEGIIFLISPLVFIYSQKLRKTDKKLPFFRNFFLLFMSISLIITFIGMMSSKLIIRIFYGISYINSALALKILFIACFFMIINFMLTQSSIAFNKEKFYSRLTIICAFVNIILNFFLIPKFGANGAAISTVVTEIILTIGMLDNLSDIIHSLK